MYGPKVKYNNTNIMTRNESITTLRPIIHTIKEIEDTTDVEKFQNQVIRPILKYQHEVIVQYIHTKAMTRDRNFSPLNTIEKERFLDKIIFKDNKINQVLIGIVIGLFTTIELNTFLDNESEYKRRMSSMIRERFLSTL